MEYNPYDLVTLRIGGQEIHGRPYEFDSQATNQQTMQNEFGGFVKPTHISTVCPECGQGIMVENIKLPDPPFPVIDWVCPNCNPGVEPPVDPFMNPLDAGRVADYQLDPLLHNPDEQIMDDSNETVADRIGEIDDSQVAHTTSAMLVESEKATKKKATKTTKKKTTKKTTKKKVKKAAEKRSPIKGAKMSSDALQSPPEAHEAPLLTTEKLNTDGAEGLSEEFDDDDMVENE